MTARKDRQRTQWAACGPYPHSSGMAGLDWAPKPVRPGWGGRMAGEGGEQSPVWATWVSRPEGGPIFLSSAPGGRQATPISLVITWGLHQGGVCPEGQEQSSSLSEPQPHLTQPSWLLGWPGRDSWAGGESRAAPPWSAEPDAAPRPDRRPGNPRTLSWSQPPGTRAWP